MAVDPKFRFSEEDSEEEQGKQVLSFFGLAVYTAQVLEHQLANMVVFYRIYSGLADSQSKMEKALNKYLGKNFGELVNEAIKKYDFSEDEKTIPDYHGLR